jgi:WD40 repeat protein
MNEKASGPHFSDVHNTGTSVIDLYATFVHFSPKAPLYNMSGHEEKILCVDWSIPSLLLSGAADNHLKIFHYNDTQSYKGR